MFIVGLPSTVTGNVASDAQLPISFVKVNVAVPAPTPVTTPLLVTVATNGSLLVQLPPILGLNDVVSDSQIISDPTILTVGLPIIVTGKLASELHVVTLFV